ncbi:uncharacterized protein LOC128868606 isoform X1 [Anastrepha ludens]|uniref:uncharacterized protein LOC128868606 isoform X1 n=2 Tax=Anastrepha ludens TaxID=28586 RepID=UPI0023B07FB3|nr:uncharacterized protein LOC128868606 isoform X1 [Anastrepha ludens]XP_053966863.1 uncharacterized protein LOC128868606 isoform X1 [Anastrepha ludens]XP_053966864.1 uncharacterized protein LOC128868606 isoform X1 [Anastrepha ludens]
MISALLSRLIILSFGTLYPAYASYKAVRTKNVKEYVKWMMYWIVYAFFTCIETFTDIFLSWFPFYYEVKVIIVLWLLSPATKGSSTLYRKFVHPMLTRREQEIDEYLNQAKERGYSAVLQLGTKGVNYATNVIMQTALKGGGNLVQTIRRSYSLSDLSEPDVHRTQDEIDDVVQMRSQPRMLRPRTQPGIARSASGTRHSTGMYFSEVDVVKGADGFNYNIRSSEDISSGYSSAEPVSAGLSRTSSMTNASKTRLKAKRTEIVNDPKQFRPTERELFQPSPLPMPGFGHLKTEIGSDGCERLENSAVFDAQKCIHTSEDMPHAKSKNEGDIYAKEAAQPQSKMQTIEEINDFENSFEMENAENVMNFVKITEMEEQPTHSDTTRQQQDKYEPALPQESLSFKDTDAEVNEVEVGLTDEISFKDNNSICSNTDTFNTLESSDEDNESDEFSDALPSLADDDDGIETVKEEKLTDQTVKENETSQMLYAEKDSVEPIATTQAATEASPTPAELSKMSKESKFEKPKVSAKQLQDTLKEIKDNFRATIAPTTSLPTTTTYDSSKLLAQRLFTHNKGKAPAPPLPPRPTRPVTMSDNVDTVISAVQTPYSNTVDATSISSRSPSPVPHKSIFKNLKTNLFRFTSNSSLVDKQNDGNVEKSTHASPPYETQI